MSTALNNTPLLDVQGLSVDLLDHTTGQPTTIVRDFGLQLFPGRAIGITGLSGSGKSTVGLALAGLLGHAASVHANRWMWQGASLVPGSVTPFRVPQNLVRQRVGHELLLILQDARSSLVPYHDTEWHLHRAGGPPTDLGMAGVVAAATSRLAGRWGRRRANRYEQGLPIDQLLRDCGFDDPTTVAGKPPDQLSTGECQRVQLAMARQRAPRVLIADEPFASLDGTLRRRFIEQILLFLAAGNGLIFISHLIDVLRELTEETIVICNGYVAERGPTRVVLDRATCRHPHTQLLFDCHNISYYANQSRRLWRPDVPCVFQSSCHMASQECRNKVPATHTESGFHQWSCDQASLTEPKDQEVPAPSSPTTTAPDLTDVVLRVDGISCEFPRCSLNLPWDFEIRSSERLGLLAPSGSGKTTLARAVMGTIPFRGTLVRFPTDAARQPDKDHRQPTGAALRALWRRVQLVHQDTDLVFDPGALMGETLDQAWRVSYPKLTAGEAWRRSVDLFAELHLPIRLLHSPPALLSGGERRRAAIAHRLAVFGYDSGLDVKADTSSPPRLLILDEPTVGLDEVMQAVVAKTLLRAWRQQRLTYLVFSHDRRFVQRFCTRQLLSRGQAIRSNVS